MQRREFLKKSLNGMGTAGLSYLFPLSGCTSRRFEQPNILWLISEDTSADLGCYGNSIVKTPHLDQLAQQGLRFTNAIVSCPVCSPVRSGLMTGMYQTSIGAHQHRTWQKSKLPDPVKVVTEYFRECGYFTSNCAGLNYEKKGKTDLDFIIDKAPFDGTDWRPRKAGQTFFAQINFSLTHRKFVRDEKNPIDPNEVQLPPYYPDHPVTRRDWANYLESLQVLDRQVGRVLARLDQDGLRQNTIVFYFGDHGRPHVRGKQWLYEGGIHVPLIVRWPDHFQAGKVVDDLVSSIDLAPTILDLAGISPPGHIQGFLFLSKNKKKRQFVFSARDRCDETIDRIRSVRTKRYKYIRNFMPERPYTQFNAYKMNQYPVLTLLHVLYKKGDLTPDKAKFMAEKKPDEELYDLKNDPYELKNLVDRADNQQILTELRSELNNWILTTGDRGEIPESEEEIVYWQQRMAKKFKGWMANKGLDPEISPEDYLKYWQKELFDK